MAVEIAEVICLGELHVSNITKRVTNDTYGRHCEEENTPTHYPNSNADLRVYGRPCVACNNPSGSAKGHRSKWVNIK